MLYGMVAVSLGAPVVLAQATGVSAVSAGVQATDGTAASGSARLTRSGKLWESIEAEGFAPGAPAFIRIFKESSELEVWLSNTSVREAGGKPAFKLFKTYRICKWSGKIGPKLAEGDHQSPEGFYAIERWQLRPYTKNHRAIEIGFPNAYDRSHGRTGSHIQIHGGCGSEGCFAMTDRGIEEIYDIVEAALEAGQKRVPLHIFPFRMNAARLADNKSHQWRSFWQALKPVHDAFPKVATVPDVSVCAKSYRTGIAPKGCVKPWYGAKKQYFAGSSGRTAGPRIPVKCNLRRASCKRWLALAKRRLAKGGKLFPTASRRRQ